MIYVATAPGGPPLESVFRVNLGNYGSQPTAENTVIRIVFETVEECNAAIDRFNDRLTTGW
jgi:hypothetical protein